MARNGLAGKHPSYKKRKMSKAAIAKKKKYDSEYQKKKSAVKKRVQANKANRKAGTYGNGDGKDASHGKGGKIKMESKSKNRARNGQKKGKSPRAKRTGTKR
tara:strand:- start:153 stop:458 length:306 start_codon:yes stop_codon:yes gene_type:complete